ncbi:TrmB family transcriptional regulator (plasmid) [Halolamina sp. CBA1230]|uniref:TrmB family transcriptional regulator n=1 Tax=Halolamina sp. CBA1230 TaxID=1853690 RepID=UPI001593E208|nr:TrmB family transcriptional regulator [Halolamina sp. CBA1230]QKY21948.1 TrmB family transcriptional regulator [Halolamina sp. CBA1230]
MNDGTNRQDAIELLQELGLKEYEARSFVALARRENGTAKDISEMSEVPRTRVYDAIRVLESKGLVETQHTSPQVFRAVSIDEAVNTLRTEYADRVSSLRSALRGLEPPDDESEDVTHEVWSLSGEQGITSRTQQLIEGASEEVVLVIGHDDTFTDRLAAALQDAEDRGVTVIVGAASEPLRATIEAALPNVEVFVSGLEWLQQSSLPGDTTEISRLLLVDRQAILVSSFTRNSESGHAHEQAVFGRGFDNGLVAIVRRLMATGLLSEDDPVGQLADRG